MSKVPEVIEVDTPESLEYHLTEVQEGLALRETEDTWEKILRAIGRLHALVKGGACGLPDVLVPALKALSQPINQCITTERSRLSGATVECIASIAEGLSKEFEPLVPSFFPTLLSMTTRTNKVFVGRARGCVLAIIESTQLSSLVPHLRRAVGDKSKSLRLVVTDATLACLTCFNPPDLAANARAEDIETIIRSTLRDADSEVRKGSRRVFDAYCQVLPERVDAFVGPLTPTVRKYLEVKTMGPKTQQSAVLARKARPGPHVSSSILATSGSSRVPEGTAEDFPTRNPKRMVPKKTFGVDARVSSREQTRLQAQAPILARDVKNEPIRPTIKQKNSQAALKPERVMSASSRTAPAPASGPNVAPTIFTSNEVHNHHEPRRPVLMDSGAGLRHARRSRDDVGDVGSDRPQTHQDVSRPSSRMDIVMTSSTSVKTKRPMSIRERLIGNARRPQQLPPPPPLLPPQSNDAIAVPSREKSKEAARKPSHNESKGESRKDLGVPSKPSSSRGKTTDARSKSLLKDVANRPGSQANRLSNSRNNETGEPVPVHSTTRMTKSGLSESSDRDALEFNKVDNGEQEMLSKVRTSRDAPQQEAITADSLLVMKTQPVRVKVPAAIITPRKARTATNRGVQPLIIRKTLKARAVTRTAKYPSIVTETDGTNKLKACVDSQANELQEETEHGDTVCDAAQVPLPVSPELSTNHLQDEKEDQSRPPLTPKARKKQLPAVTPITRLAEQIRMGFDFTVCLDETLPSPVGELSHRMSVSELGCMGMELEEKEGWTRSVRNEVVEDRRVVCESNTCS